MTSTAPATAQTSAPFTVTADVTETHTTITFDALALTGSRADVYNALRKAIGLLHDEAELPVVPYWNNDTDGSAGAHPDGYECPHCGTRDTLNEAERALRWNRLHLETFNGEGAPIFDARYGATDWNTDEFVCGHCCGSITLPENHEINY